jgi:hypothetical protein
MSCQDGFGFVGKERESSDGPKWKVELWVEKRKDVEGRNGEATKCYRWRQIGRSWGVGEWSGRCGMGALGSRRSEGEGERRWEGGKARGRHAAMPTTMLTVLACWCSSRDLSLIIIVTPVDLVLVGELYNRMASHTSRWIV